ncbi:hypothetical protein G8S55_11575 [Clostridium botulinum C]|uniref:hypothetical protein n=1 Tax=Clostridium botulinum TaxID=1491 RepID=UPI001E3C453F|nr:hypothetical protein [Clostridium botulinum]MCD3217857.1 hypothetical protein [Clostridium botulinum C]
MKNKYEAYRKIRDKGVINIVKALNIEKEHLENLTDNLSEDIDINFNNKQIINKINTQNTKLIDLITQLKQIKFIEEKDIELFKKILKEIENLISKNEKNIDILQNNIINKGYKTHEPALLTRYLQ